MDAPKLKHKLVTFKLCPFSMKVVALMKFKNFQAEIQFIEMSNKPEWFEKISPLSRVPILIVGEEDVLFESSAILQYIDEITQPRLMPSDPIPRALERARFEYSDELLKNLSCLIFCQDEAKFFQQKEMVKKQFKRVQDWLGNNKYMNGNEISLIDFSFLSIFVYLQIFKPILPLDLSESYAKLFQYGDRLINLPFCKAGKVPDFEFLILDCIRTQKSFFYRQNPCFFVGQQAKQKCSWFSCK